MKLEKKIFLLSFMILSTISFGQNISDLDSYTVNQFNNFNKSYKTNN